MASLDKIYYRRIENEHRPCARKLKCPWRKQNSIIRKQWSKKLRSWTSNITGLCLARIASTISSTNNLMNFTQKAKKVVAHYLNQEIALYTRIARIPQPQRNCPHWVVKIHLQQSTASVIHPLQAMTCSQIELSPIAPDLRASNIGQTYPLHNKREKIGSNWRRSKKHWHR